ncbi:30S ribosomal protein S6 [Candidatus Falkowbacteria bacterium]|jgi:small subunit ribosomal protein S6|nr:30S ribosomal protein S6 [Candidatus Falkowbacteria bacterium]MBT4432853.1 30S ribosomal protein S6 [Candidatus Falkowbacteria bacterium]
MNYELLFIVPNKYSDDEVKEINQKVISTVKENGGDIQSTQDWGKKKLAYQIKHFRYGYYTLVIFAGEPDTPEKITQKLNINTDVIRFQIVKEVKRSKPFSPDNQDKVKVEKQVIEKTVEKKEEKPKTEKTAKKDKEEKVETKPEKAETTDDKPEETKKKEPKDKVNGEARESGLGQKASIDELDKKLDELLDSAI